MPEESSREIIARPLRGPGFDRERIIDRIVELVLLVEPDSDNFHRLHGCADATLLLILGDLERAAQCRENAR